MPHYDRNRKCELEYCDKPHSSHGYCERHRQLIKQGRLCYDGTVLPTSNQYKPQGPPKRSIDKRGYVDVVVFGKNKSEHRWVMEMHLGRDLLPGENVHHKNGIRDDNRIENLELWSTSQPAGQRVEDKTAWAIEWLRNYKPEVLKEDFA